MPNNPNSKSGKARTIVTSVRMEPVLARRVEAYAAGAGATKADAIRALIEKGLACDALTVFATPVGGLIRDVIEAEFNLMRAEMEESSDRLEERVAKVGSRGTKVGIATQAMPTDVSRVLIPAWRDTPAEDLWKHYSRVGGEVQAGIPYPEAKAGL